MVKGSINQLQKGVRFNWGMRLIHDIYGTGFLPFVTYQFFAISVYLIIIIYLTSEKNFQGIINCRLKNNPNYKCTYNIFKFLGFYFKHTYRQCISHKLRNDGTLLTFSVNNFNYIWSMVSYKVHNTYTNKHFPLRTAIKINVCYIIFYYQSLMH